MEATTEHHMEQVTPEVTPLEQVTGEVTLGDVSEHSMLVERLTSYSLINSLYQTYDSVKQASPLLKYGLETAESLSTPVLVQLDSTLGLEEKGNQVLDKLEGQVSAATKLYQEKKDEAVTQGLHLVQGANKQVHQLLDITESLVDKILPPDMEFEYQEVGEDGIAVDIVKVEKVEGNPLPRVTALGTGLPKRLKAAALSRMSTFDIRSATQIEALAYVIDLIQYAADYIDVDKQKRVLLQASEAVKERVGENLDTVNLSFVSPIKEVIDKHTEDIKTAGVKTVVGVVATIAQAVEVVRRQLFLHLGSSQKLQEELANYTLAAKKAVESMKDHDLVDYINLVKENTHTTLTKIVELLNSYAPTHLTQSLPSLVSWSESINQRLSAAAEEIMKKSKESS